MAQTNNSIRATEGSFEGRPDSFSSKAISSGDKALAEKRIERFVSDKTPSVMATLAFKVNRDLTADALKLAAEQRMAAKLLAFDDVFDNSTATRS